MRTVHIDGDVYYITDKGNIYNLFDTYMVSVYNKGKYVCQFGPDSLERALHNAHVYDGFKHIQAVVWDATTGKDVYKSQMEN